MSKQLGPVPVAMAALGERLRRTRLRANLTQEALAAIAGVSVRTVANAEDGRNISLETLLELLRGLDRLEAIDTLLADEGPSPVELARRRGRERQRASGERQGAPHDPDTWEW